MASGDTDIPEQVIEEVGAACPGGALDDAGMPRLSEDQQEAWVGFMAAHAGIIRALESGLGTQFGISVGALEVLSRLAGESSGQVRMSELAQGGLLSQSRVSRIVDSLELRGLVERTSCPSDSRGVFALITPAGRELTERALRWHWAQIRERFFDPLEGEQVAGLGAIWRAILSEL
jgi:DNA-binding MarR family transcriptional regulator